MIDLPLKNSSPMPISSGISVMPKLLVHARRTARTRCEPSPDRTGDRDRFRRGRSREGTHPCRPAFLPDPRSACDRQSSTRNRSSSIHITFRPPGFPWRTSGSHPPGTTAPPDDPRPRHAGSRRWKRRPAARAPSSTVARNSSPRDVARAGGRAEQPARRHHRGGQGVQPAVGAAGGRQRALAGGEARGIGDHDVPALPGRARPARGSGRRPRRAPGFGPPGRRLRAKFRRAASSAGRARSTVSVDGHPRRRHRGRTPRCTRTG